MNPAADRIRATAKARVRHLNGDAEPEAHFGVFDPVIAAGDDPRPEPPGDTTLDTSPRAAIEWERADMVGLGAYVSPPIEWFWNGYVPPHLVTVLGGHGGAGKSTVALILAAHVAAGLPYLGRATRRSRVLFFSGEDSAAMVRARLSKIVRRFELPVESLEESLHVIDASDLDPVLYQEARGERGGATTPGYEGLRAYVDAYDIGLIVVDNATDCFDGDEIRRASVRGFMRSLAALARPDRAVLLLVHIDKASARGNSSETYSGSTAWHNSARSRLFVRQEDSRDLELRHEKCNVAPRQEPVHLIWPLDGLPDLPTVQTPFLSAIKAESDAKTVLRLIHEFTARGEFVSTATTSRTHAGKLLRKERGFPPNLVDADLFDLLRRAERAGHIARVTYKGTDRHERERWEVTDSGKAHSEIAATAATAATTEVNASRSARGACGDCGDSAGGYGGKPRRTMSPRETPMSAESGISRSWACGRYTCTLTMPKPRPNLQPTGPRVQHISIEWEPELPERLDETELAQYRVGRDRALAEITAEFGIASAVVEL